MKRKDLDSILEGTQYEAQYRLSPSGYVTEVKIFDKTDGATVAWTRGVFQAFKQLKAKIDKGICTPVA